MASDRKRSGVGIWHALRAACAEIQIRTAPDGEAKDERLQRVLELAEGLALAQLLVARLVLHHGRRGHEVVEQHRHTDLREECGGKYM